MVAATAELVAGGGSIMYMFFYARSKDFLSDATHFELHSVCLICSTIIGRMVRGVSSLRWASCAAWDANMYMGGPHGMQTCTWGAAWEGGSHEREGRTGGPQGREGRTGGINQSTWSGLG